MGRTLMGTIALHEFTPRDGVFEDPRWTFDYHRETSGWNDKVHIARTVNAAKAIALDVGPHRYAGFDSGAARKYVLLKEAQTLIAAAERGDEIGQPLK
jgi:hypothetical protein